jgi:transcriptional regulator with XRE-family HTH domain
MRGLTQQQMAKASGLPRATWANLETGGANPTLSVLHRVASALQVTIEELISRPRTAAQLYPRERLPTRKRGDVTVRSLVPDPIPGLAMERLQLPRGGRMIGIPHTPGTREYLACESGEILLVAGGEQWRLRPLERRCNDEPVECPDGANCEINCLDEDTCQAEITCPDDGNCVVNCSDIGTCTELIDCGNSVNCEVNCDEDDSCQSNFAVQGKLAALTLLCQGDGTCSGNTIECGGAGCLIACDGIDTCDGDMRLEGRKSVLDCNGTQSCSGLIDCSIDQEGCQVNCRGADSCLQPVTDASGFTLLALQLRVRPG